MTTEDRRQALRSGARMLFAAALGALAVRLGWRAVERDAGYCDRAGRCGGCAVTERCDAFQAMHGGPRP